MMHIRSVDSMVTKNRAKTKGKRRDLKLNNLTSQKLHGPVCYKDVDKLDYRRVHFDFFLAWDSGKRTTLIASSKMSLRPAWVNAEHSL